MENDGDAHRWDEEGDPAHHDKHGGGEVDEEDEGAEWSAEKNLKPVSTVVAWVDQLEQFLRIIKPTWTSNKNSLMWRQIFDVHIEGQRTLVFPGF